MQPRTKTNYHSFLIFIAVITCQPLPSTVLLVMFFAVIQVKFLFISMHFSILMFIFPSLLKRLRNRVSQGTMDLGAVGSLLSILFNQQQLKRFKEKKKSRVKQRITSSLIPMPRKKELGKTNQKKHGL